MGGLAVDAIQIIKDLVILDFIKFIKHLNYGHVDNYLHILAKISFIDSAFTLKDATSIFEKLTSYE